MMKKIIALTAALCMAAVCLGQEATGYKSFFGQESTVWNGITEYYDIPPENHMLSTSYDTTIDDVTYKKIEYALIWWYNGYREDRYSSRDFYLREDTATGRLWCRFADEDEDFIIADMSLSLHDTITLRVFSRYDYYTVNCTVTDTFSNDNGRVLVLDGYPDTRDPLLFIEGVGCTKLFDYARIDVRNMSPIVPAFLSELVCCHKDGEAVYHFPNLDGWLEENCIIKECGIEEVKETITISVWPNPCNDWLHIRCDENIESAILYNVKGNVVMDNIYDKEHLCLKNVPHGIYVLHIETNTSKSQIKIIKQ